ncbi:hypothetical protein [Xanthovirga aplysinae]|uniref:hypothetical protein n=1 Tax=Xanthovirga aplysinae TaxID=2529853 RepID=UPI0012BD495A|nr:hypothetical protein [Xanthovirga aplysinae]
MKEKLSKHALPLLLGVLLGMLVYAKWIGKPEGISIGRIKVKNSSQTDIKDLIKENN